MAGPIGVLNAGSSSIKFSLFLTSGSELELTVLFRMPFDQVAGVVAGACGNPAILAYSNELAPSDRPDIAYAMIFPGMTIVKILFVEIVPAFFGG